MSDKLAAFLCIVSVMVGMLIGMNWALHIYRLQAIGKNAAYYHPVTGDFTWRTNLPPITINQ